MRHVPHLLARPRRLALVAVLVVTSAIAGTAGAATTRDAGVRASGLTAVTTPPVADSPYGDVADWGTVTGTDGRVYIADANGRALQFHGFNRKTQDPDDVTDALLDQAAERGLDHLRLTVFWQDIEPTQGNYDQAYLDKVVAAIERCASHGIRVILDMHQDVYGQAFNSVGAPDWATRSDGLPYTPQASWLLDYLQPAVQAAFNAWTKESKRPQREVSRILSLSVGPSH